MSTQSGLQTSTIIIASAGAVVTGLLAYAVYFDHKRQTDPDFRRKLKQESRRAARAAKQQAEAQGQEHKKAVEKAVQQAQADGIPTDNDDKEAFFMSQVSQGETLAASESTHFDSALCFYKALKVYYAPKDLISIYDKTVPKPVLDILAEMIAVDPSIHVDASLGATSNFTTGIDD